MEPLTVTEVSELVKSTIKDEPRLQDIAVRGEVTNYSDKKHHYFNIKDASSSLKCVIWSSCARGMECLPLQNGQRVVVWGSITTYQLGSTYQLDVRKLVPEGRGDLYARFLELRQRLYDEGLFAPERKRPLPAYPESVGIITSEKGAALQDMVKVFMAGPGIKVVTCDARVQGEGAADTISDGIKALDGRADVIIIGRGGGSIEELWAFNDERLARTIYACGTPIISAVGHEIDEVISDNVADLRASTPTAAAEMVVKAMQKAIDEKVQMVEGMEALACEKARNARQLHDGYDMEMRRKLLARKVENSRGALGALRSGLGYSVSRRASDARGALSAGDAALRTTWVAALAENGLAALYQDGRRVKDAAAFNKGQFKGLMRDGRITGEVDEIEI